MHATTASRRPACGVKEAQDKAEKAIYACQAAVGGDEGTCGLSGSLTAASLGNVLSILTKEAALGGRSVVVDVGASIGKLLVQCMAQVKVAAAIGIEICDKKVDKAEAVLQMSCAALKDMGGREKDMKVICGSAGQVGALSPPPTHFFAFWQGFNPRDKHTVADLVMRHSSRRAVVIIQEHKKRDIEQEMELYGFRGLRLLDTVPVTMSGSNHTKHAHIFIVEDWAPTGAGRLEDLSDEGRPSWWYRAWEEMAQQRRKLEQEAAWGAGLAAGQNLRLTANELFAARLAYRAPSVLSEIKAESEYRPVPFAPPGYEVNAHGSVRRERTHAPLWAYPLRDGHWYVQFSTDSPDKVVLAVRILVAVVFIPDALEKLKLDEKGRQQRGGCTPRVFHIDGVKSHNRVTNLVLRTAGASSVDEEAGAADGRADNDNNSGGGSNGSKHQRDPSPGGGVRRSRRLKSM
ncbi:hypothetical protein PLESTF_001564700 [Pleodorina starrii]|nr:hypothetical protein PLESTF_001564700 [Pleodorina starrii]